MKMHLILEPTIWFRVRAFMGALWMSLSRLLAVFSSKKINIKDKKIVPATAFSKHWAGRFELKQGEELRLKRLKGKYHL